MTWESEKFLSYYQPLFLWFYARRGKGKFLDEVLGGCIAVSFDVLFQDQVQRRQMGPYDAYQLD